MSGFSGNPDAESEHALILNENAIEAARAAIPKGPGSPSCLDCGEPIPEARRQAQPGCTFCIVCQPHHDKRPQIKMLDRIL